MEYEYEEQRNTAPGVPQEGGGPPEGGGTAAADGPPAEERVEELPPGSLIILSAREKKEPDADVVRGYVEALKRGDRFPPIVVYEDMITQKRFSGDGRHRNKAYQELDRNIPVRIVRVQNAERRALLDSLKANHRHGLPRTNADKRKAVIIALADRKLRKLKPPEIAEACAVSPTFVREIQKELRKKKQDEALKIAAAPTSGPSVDEVKDVVMKEESRKPCEGMGTDRGDTDDADTAAELEVVPSAKDALRQVVDIVGKLSAEEGWTPDEEALDLIKAIQVALNALHGKAVRGTGNDGFDASVLSAFMTKHNIKDVVLADRFGVKRPTVNRWRNGHVKPNANKRAILMSMMALDGDALAAWLQGDQEVEDVGGREGDHD